MICKACESGLKTHPEHIRCPYCGCIQEALSFLIAHNLDPWEMHQKLSGRTDYFGVTMDVARQLVEIYGQDKEKAH